MSMRSWAAWTKPVCGLLWAGAESAPLTDDLAEEMTAGEWGGGAGQGSGGTGGGGGGGVPGHPSGGGGASRDWGAGRGSCLQDQNI